MKPITTPRTPNHVPRFFLLLFIFSLTLTSCQQQGTTVDAVETITFSHKIPVDVDPALQAKLKQEGNIYELNQTFNQYSWQAMIAIMWPLDEEGNPAPKFNGEGLSTWLGWKEAFQVYRADGRIPSDWGSERDSSGLKIPKHVLGDANARPHLSSSTPTHPDNFNIADEVDQAFAGQLFDQNGNVVVYEVLMNKSEYDYIMDNELYNVNGQLKFSKTNPLANFPKGNYETGDVGAVEIKFAWKILEDSDHKDRYYRNEGYIKNETTHEWEKKDLGMIGLHISQKTPTGKQWVWSTFEHVDNLRQNVIEKDGKTTVIPPSLTDPNCEICPVNLDVTHNKAKPHYQHHTSDHGDYWTIGTDTTKYFASSDIMKTQSKRMVDIPVRVQQVNEKMQAYFRSQNSVWQYYELIDTQYPLDQDAPPAPNHEDDYLVPESVNNKPGGNANIAMLTNISMETFFQDGNQLASNLMEDNPSSYINIFGTESCMGCHSSAGLYNQYFPANDSLSSAGQLSGDFSWLLGKAKWDDTKLKQE